MVYAATYPERVAALALYNPVAKGVRSPDYPWANSSEEWEEWLGQIHTNWGTLEYAAESLRAVAPSAADDPAMVEWMARVHRLGASPGAAEVVLRMAMTVDVREVLPSIRVPTLVLYRDFARGEAAFVAERVPGARAVEIGGPDTMFWLAEGLVDEIVGFFRGVTEEPVPDTVLATILFTGHRRLDASGRWSSATEPGRISSSVTTRPSGRSSTASTAASWTPRATASSRRSTARSAPSVVQPRSESAVGDLGLVVRAGLHAGECEVIGEKLGGVAVIVGARVAAQADAGEILVSSTVKDLVAGSGIEFEDRGVATLKGLPDEWRLYAVAG